MPIFNSFRLRLCIFFFFTFLIHQSLFALESWERIGPAGGPVVRMESYPDNPNIMLCAVLNEAVFISTNRGEQWSQIMDKSIYDITLISGGKGWMAGPAGLYFSENYGQTWRQIKSCKCWQVEATETGIVAVDTLGTRGTEKIPWQISLDWGETWQPWQGTELGQSPRYTGSLRTWENRGSILFHQNSDIYRSDDIFVFKSSLKNPNEWQLLSGTNDNGERALYLLTEANSDSVIWGFSRYVDWHPGGYLVGGILQTSDSGNSWQRVYLPNLCSVTSLAKFESFLFVGSEDGEFYQYAITTGQSKLLANWAGEITDIDCRNWAKRELMVATLGGIYKTEDGGKSWTRCDTGISFIKANAVRLVPISHYNERILIGVDGGGIWYSDDNGANWICGDSSINVLPGMLWYAPENPEIVYAGSERIYYSENGGENWQEFPEIIEEFVAYYGWYGRLADIDIFPDSPYHILVNYFDHSLDDYRGIVSIIGEKDENKWSFQKIHWFGEEGFENLSHKAQFDLQNNWLWISQFEWYYCDVSPALKAMDSETFETHLEITLPDTSSPDIWQIYRDKVFIFNEKRTTFWYSNDLGRNWNSSKIYNLKNIGQYQADPHSLHPWGEIKYLPEKNHLFLILPNNGILSSKDGGATWHQQNGNLPTSAVLQIEFSRLNPSLAYVATQDGLFRSEMVTHIEESNQSSSKWGDFRLSPNYPNPFNAGTKIQFYLPQSEQVKLSIFNVTGQQIARLIDSSLSEGSHSIHWDGCSENGPIVSSGIYWYRLETGSGKVLMGKMVYIK